MGACLEPLAETAPFAQEARRESFYIGTGSAESVMRARKGRDGIDPAFSVPAAHAAAFRAGLEQVRGFSAIAERAEATRVPLDPWSVSVADGEVVVQGPVCVYGVGTSWAPCETIEIKYAYLDHLLAALSGA